ncbi:uncharacterized protein [Drosophila virilis]|uniref:Cytochrome b561 domain-containing protein n=1 Tax=Drosophila virilis TaxID=7244 RepID=B4MCR8_DROVI|nr:uncharacterized protein LOC6635566 [Drosophila virilis]EDW57990.2 uncharacterized protein Dvir_GJ15289 [Drosophila virilis]
MDIGVWTMRGLKELALEEDEVEVNATGETLQAFVWPTVSTDFYFHISEVIANFMFIVITVLISRKCLILRLQRTAEHVFYCTLAQMLSVAETLMLRNLLLHTIFGMMCFVVGFFGVGLQILLKHKRARGTRRHFRSSHSIFGLAGCLLMSVSFFTGICLLLYPMRKQVCISVLFVHRVCGLFCFIILMASFMFSYNTGFMHRNWEQRRIWLFKFCTIIATITASCYEFKCFVRDATTLIPKEVFESISIYVREEQK